MKKPTTRPAMLALATFALLTLFGADAFAGWKYKYFSTKPSTPTPQTKMTDWINQQGPRSKNLRVVPATNGVHIWLRDDHKNQWKMQINNSFNAFQSLNAIKTQGDVFAGFLRATVGSTKIHGTVLLDLVSGPRAKSNKWKYKHFSAKGNWKVAVNAFINQHGPKAISGIQGGLSNGKDFHIYVRRDRGKCKWTIKNQQMPPKSASLLGGTVRNKIASGRLAPIGFNTQSPNHLWYVERKKSKGCP